MIDELCDKKKIVVVVHLGLGRRGGGQGVEILGLAEVAQQLGRVLEAGGLTPLNLSTAAATSLNHSNVLFRGFFILNLADLHVFFSSYDS